MIDETKKYKSLINIPENKSISYDLHHIFISYQGKKSNLERFIYTKKYAGKGVILDFYKPNSNILFIKNEEK